MPLLKRLIAISLLSLYLVAGTELRELFKLPLLVQHYQEHKKADQALNFFSFLCMHYGGDDNNTQDEDRDMQLPFKSCDDSFAGCVVLPPVQDVELDITPLNGKNAVVQKSQDIRSFYEASIWQPPKIRFI